MDEQLWLRGDQCLVIRIPTSKGFGNTTPLTRRRHNYAGDDYQVFVVLFFLCSASREKKGLRLSALDANNSTYFRGDARIVLFFVFVAFLLM